MSRICIIGASGKLGQYMVEQALNRGYEVNAVCRAKSVGKLARFGEKITIHAGQTDDPEVIQQATQGCRGVLTVLVPWGVNDYASGTARAVLEHAPENARLVFSCGWHISKDGEDVYSWQFRTLLSVVGWLARTLRLIDIDDQVAACKLIFASKHRWTVVRGSDLEEGASQGLPVWSHHVGDPVLASNRTRRIDFALFMLHALEDDSLIHQAPAIVGCQTASALAHVQETG